MIQRKTNMATNKYSRTSSGYTAEDEKKAKRAAEMERALNQNTMDRKNAGEKGLLMSNYEVGSFAKNAERIYKDNLATEKGRARNEEDTKYYQNEVNKMLTPNSRAQYKAEKAAGGAQTDLSYEEWKNLD